MAHQVTVFFDYHCPFCFRVERWLAELGPDHVEVGHRFLSLEQLNRDPEASSWRIWEQPLDYEHHRGRPDRRSLAAFLATAMAEGAGGPSLAPDLVDRLRMAIFAARHEAGLDISRVDVLDRVAVAAGLAPGWLANRLADSDAIAAARARIAGDWDAARSPVRLFGVPTLVIDDAPPFYLRLERVPTAAEGPRLLEWLCERSDSLPFVLELKLPPRPGSETGGRPGTHGGPSTR